MFRKSEHKRCQEGENCVGPGCKAQTGKTARKHNKQQANKEKK